MPSTAQERKRATRPDDNETANKRKTLLQAVGLANLGDPATNCSGPRLPSKRPSPSATPPPLSAPPLSPLRTSWSLGVFRSTPPSTNKPPNSGPASKPSNYSQHTSGSGLRLTHLTIRPHQPTHLISNRTTDACPFQAAMCNDVQLYLDARATSVDVGALIQSEGSFLSVTSPGSITQLLSKSVVSLSSSSMLIATFVLFAGRNRVSRLLYRGLALRHTDCSTPGGLG
mgnify:CR=1 FL=1